MKITIEYPDDMDIRDVTFFAHDMTVSNAFEEECKLICAISYDREISVIYKHTGLHTRKFILKWTEEHNNEDEDEDDDEQVLSE